MVNRKYLKKAAAIITAFTCIAGMTGCESMSAASETVAAATAQGSTAPAENMVQENTSSQKAEQTSGGQTEEIDTWKEDAYQEIILNGSNISTEAEGVTVEGTTATITAAGTYVISGTLEDGRIIVNATKEDKVILVLNGVQITCKDSSPIYIIRADKTIFYLADGTENTISDGESYVFDDGETEPDAAVFAKDDLTIKGTGSLTVNANYYDGIVCKNDLKITGGILTVNAVNQGIKGKDSLTIKGGTITVTAGDDGIKSSNDAQEEDGKEVGWVLIEDGILTITAGDDAIHAESDLTINGGSITITESYEGLEGANIYLNGGDISLYASDDGINAAGYPVTGSSGEAANGWKEGENPLEIPEGEKAMGGLPDENMKNIPQGNRPDREMPGENDTQKNGEESAAGERIAGESSTEAGMMERPAFDKGWGNPGDREDMGGMGTVSSGGYLEINGGTIYVNAEGDGIDVNGSAVMNGGTVRVDGPEGSGDGALDYDETFEINGGLLIAVGSRTMAQTATSGSAQYSAAVYFTTEQAAGSTITVQDASGAEIFSYTPQKSYSFLTFSSEKLAADNTYTVLIDGTEQQSVTISEIITSVGNNAGMGGMGGHGGRNHGTMPNGGEMALPEGKTDREMEDGIPIAPSEGTSKEESNKPEL